ncbi:MAG: hypothetical protein Q9225_004183 [Loekoesia sp. 1 TL-2023]
MGKSRSATLILAYLIADLQIYTPAAALMLLRRGRPMAEPNPGFMDQLHLYHRMHCPLDVASQPLYQRWCYKREVERSKKAEQAPGSEFIVFEDEAPPDEENDDGKPKWDIDSEEDEGKDEETAKEEYRCRRCRTQLGNSSYLVLHTPRNTSSTQCAHLFLHPLSWMRPVLSQGNLDGRLECPNARCKQNVGKYAWQGMKCSCGEWVVPGISIGRGKVDVVRRKEGS